MKRISFQSPLFWISALLMTLSCKKDPVNISDQATDESANYTVSTFVGNGINGNDLLTGGLALLYAPGETALDGQGNLYIADGYNDRIRKVDPSGNMTNFAGSTIGYADGRGTAAKFARPFLLTIDDRGNFYVGEGQGLRIRKITSAAEVTTLAGNGIAGYVDGTGISAQIDNPSGMVTDPQGNIYFSQANFHGVRKITSSGIVTTFAGNPTPGYAEGSGLAARFNEPYVFSSDEQGNIYVSDRNNLRIRKISADGAVSTVLQRSKQNEMGKMTRDAQGNFYIAQGEAFIKTEIVKIGPDGRVTKIAGNDYGYEDGPGNKAKFTAISGMRTDGAGTLYVTDLFNNAVRKIRRN